MNEMRKVKREDLIMKRRGLNFITDSVADTMDSEAIANLENEVDNVAPKVVAILALSEACDVTVLRTAMVSHCHEYQTTMPKGKNKESESMEEVDSQFKAYVCPNPGSSTNMASKKQRLIFIEINRNDP